MKPWELFLEHYRAFGAAPTVESYVALFEQDATLLHPGMAGPIRIDQISDFIARTLTRMPEFRFTPIRWSFGHDTIFVEARNTAVVAGKPIEWPSVYCITLRGDRVLRGRAYYDRTEVLSYFEPALGGGNNAHAQVLGGVGASGASSSDPDVEAETDERVIKPYAENWQHPDPKRFAEFYGHDARMINPGFERPLVRGELAEYYTGLLAQAPNLRLQLEQWAASPGLLFCEWLATGDFNGHPMNLRLVDRYTLADFQIREGVAYFDGLALRALVDPNVARFRDISLSASSASA